jgi:hypothetical protein
MEGVSNIQPTTTYTSQDFKTRKNLANQELYVPKSTVDFLVVPPNFFGAGYLIQGYDTKFFDGKITEIEFYNTVKESTKTVILSWGKHLTKQKFSENDSTKKLMLFCMGLLTISTLVFLYPLKIEPSANDAWFVLAWLIIGFSFFSSLVIGLKTIFSKPSFEPFDNLLTKELGKILKFENELLFESHGFKWKAGEKGIWLEVWKSNKFKEMELLQEEKEKSKFASKDSSSFPSGRAMRIPSGAIRMPWGGNLKARSRRTSLRPSHADEMYSENDSSDGSDF